MPSVEKRIVMQMAYEEAYAFTKEHYHKKDWELAVHDIPLCDETKDDVWNQAVNNVANGIEFDWFYCTKEEHDKYANNIEISEEDGID